MGRCLFGLFLNNPPSLSFVPSCYSPTWAGLVTDIWTALLTPLQLPFRLYPQLNWVRPFPRCLTSAPAEIFRNRRVCRCLGDSQPPRCFLCFSLLHFSALRFTPGSVWLPLWRCSLSRLSAGQRRCTSRRASPLPPACCGASSVSARFVPST